MTSRDHIRFRLAEFIDRPNLVTVVADSLRKDSFNRKLVYALTELSPPEFSFRPFNPPGY